MYSGFGKQQGDLIGYVVKEEGMVDLSEAAGASNAEESLVCLEPGTNEVIMSSLGLTLDINLTYYDPASNRGSLSSAAMCPV